MRHGDKINNLGRTASHRRALLSNLAIQLITHKKIVTTLAKAKATYGVDPGPILGAWGIETEFGAFSGGENVHPTQVEAVLAEHPGIADAAVVGIPDERWGEVVVAYVVRSDPALDAAACEAHCHGHPMLAGFKRPRAYRFTDQLPMTATGKKVHYQVREQAARDAADGLLQRP